MWLSTQSQVMGLKLAAEFVPWYDTALYPMSCSEGTKGNINRQVLASHNQHPSTSASLSQTRLHQSYPKGHAWSIMLIICQNCQDFKIALFATFKLFGMFQITTYFSKAIWTLGNWFSKLSSPFTALGSKPIGKGFC